MTIDSPRRQPTDRRAVSRFIGHTFNRTLWVVKFTRGSQLHQIARCLHTRPYLWLVIFEQMHVIMINLLTRNATPRRKYSMRNIRKIDAALSFLFTLVSFPFIVLSLTQKQTMPRTSLKVLCKFSNDLKYRVWRMARWASHGAAY